MNGLKKMVFISSDLIRTYRLQYHPYDGSVDKESICNAGDPNLILGLGRSTGEGISYLLQYSGLENSMDCTVHGVTNSRTRLSDFHIGQ